MIQQGPDDPLAGYSPDWRKRLGKQAAQPAPTDTADPLASYTPGWRGHVEQDSQASADSVNAAADAVVAARGAPTSTKEPPPPPRVFLGDRDPVGSSPQEERAATERLRGYSEGVRNVAAGVPKFIGSTIQGALSYTPEELRQPDVREYVRSQGADPDVLLHQAIKRRAAGEPSGPIETAANVGKGAATMGYDLQRAAQGGALWEMGEDGKPHLVSDNPEMTAGEKIRTVTELAGNAALFGSGVEPELRNVPIADRLRAAAQKVREYAGRRTATPKPAAPAPPARTPMDEAGAEAARLSARVDEQGNRLPPLSDEQRARLRELTQVLSGESERMAREEPPPPLEQSGAGAEKEPAPFAGATAESIQRYHGADQSVRPDWIYRVPTSEIAMDPARFQFKETGPEGVTPELKNVTHWNPQAAGVVSLWRDPADGLTYVVNGHHRVELARRLGVPELNAQFVDATNATEARASGAFLNMAEGRGSATDVAKFLRDAQAGPEDLAKRGVSLRGDIVRDGVALSRLAPDVFDQVATGKAPQQWGVAIGGLLEDPALQREALGAARASGKRLSKQEVTEIARQVRDAGTETVEQENLFGKQQDRHALYANRAQLAAALKRQLSTDRRLFGYVSREGRAEQLSRAGSTQIDVGAATKLAEQASQAEEIFDRLYTRSGPIAEAVHEGAKRIAQGERPGAVAADLYPAISDAVARELTAGGVAGPDRGERASAAGEGPAAPHEAPPAPEGAPPEEVGEPGRTPDSTDPSQSGFFATEARAAVSKRAPVSEEAALAMEPDVLERAASAERAYEEGAAREVFGVERAAEYERAQRVVNSSTIDPNGARYQAAERTIDGMESGLDAAQQRRLFGIGETGINAEDLGQLARQAKHYSDLASRSTPELLDSFGHLVGGERAGGDLGMRYGAGRVFRELRSRGVADDVMVQHALRNLMRKGSPAQEAGEVIAHRLQEIQGRQQKSFTTDARAAGGGRSSRAPGVQQTEQPLVDDVSARRVGMPRDLQDDINLIGEEKAHTRAVSKPGTPVRMRSGETGRVIEWNGDRPAPRGKIAVESDEPDGGTMYSFHEPHELEPIEAPRPALELRPEPEGPGGQEALFGQKAGTAASRNLAQTEAAARSDLPRLREELRLTRDPHQRMVLNSQIAQLEKLVNRAKPLTADEIKAQAAAREQEAPQVGPDQRDMFTVSAGGGGPRPLRSQAGAQAPGPVNAPAAPVAASGLARAADAVRRLFAPAGRTPEAGLTALNVREQAARLAIRGEQARAAVATFAKMWDAAPKEVRDLREQIGKTTDPAIRQQIVAKLYAQDEALQFIDRMEKGVAQPSPELTQAAAVLRDLLDGRRKAIQALGTGKLEHFIADYFPHIWENPELAQSIIGKILGKRPLEGPRSFLKQRSIPTIRDGLEAGLVPVTWNPADLTLLKLREMDRYRMGQETMAEEKAEGRARFVSSFAKAEPGTIQINDHVATVYGPPTVPVVEAFDALVREKLQQILRDLGVRHERKPNIGGQRLGYAVSSGKDIVTRSAGPDAVIMHELGHAIDFQYKLWDHLTNIPGKTKEAIRARKVVHGELRALADLRFEGQQSVDPAFHQYVRNRYEKIANAIMALMYAPEKMQRAAPTIKARLTEFLRARPELAPLLDVKPSLVHSTGTFEVPVGGMVIVGHYYAPEPVATVLNNFLSPGLSGNVLFDAYRGVGNFLNQAQLGLSAFHLAFTSMDAAVSKAALGVEQALSGRVGEGLGSLARTPIAPIENLIRGHKLLKELTHPGTGGPELAAIAESLVAGGGRVRMDAFYKNSATGKFWDAIHRGRYARAGLRAIPAMIELAAKPLMEWVVPRQKLGVFADLARFELSRLPKEATHAEARAVMAKAWDSVDNRMGQLVYDNLFWHKALKDLGMSSVRSLGWNIGTLREIGGGLADVVGAPARALKSERVLTHRMAYVVALPFVVGMAGGMMNYLFTGEPPQELKDYFFPRTGRLTPEGQPERVQLPSYMRDVFHLARHPYRTIKGKLHPLISYIADMLENEDFFGNKVRNEHDPLVTQAKQVFDYTADQFLPIGIRQAVEEKQRGQGSRSGLSFVGITPAPREEVRSQAENLTHELLGGRASSALTPEEADAAKQRRQMADALRQGDPDAMQQIRDAVRAGRLRPAQAKKMIKEKRLSSLVRGFRMLTLSEAVDVFRAADADERRTLFPYFNMKAERAAQAGDRDGIAAARALMREIRGERP